MHYSPLRYPGGKACLADYLAKTIESNRLGDGVYAEAFAGGAGAALNLLCREFVRYILLNDLDPCLFRLWRAILETPDELCGKIRNATVSVPAWRRHRRIYLRNIRAAVDPDLDVAFATLFLNRCCRSGVFFNGGPIGGFDQTGNYKIDVRFSREELIRRIERIASYRDRIRLFNMPAVTFLQRLPDLSPLPVTKVLAYLDPPYFEQGERLYTFSFGMDEHTQLAQSINGEDRFRWLVSYDDHPEIRALYRERIPNVLNMGYCVGSTKVGRELLIPSANCDLPKAVAAKGRMTSEMEEAA
jgi:DNA adenine methylase